MSSNESNVDNNITISDATVDDVEAITRMHALSWVETYVNEEQGITKEWVENRLAERLSQESINKRQQSVLDNKNNPNNCRFVAKDKNGTVIGFASPVRDDNGKQSLSGLYVASKYHGKGVANKLMEKVIEWANPNFPIYLGVATYNERAKAFYKKWGFKEISGSEKLFEGVIPEIEMIREGVSNEV